MVSSLSGLAPFPLLILLGIFFGAFKIFDLQNARTFNLFIAMGSFALTPNP